MPKLSGKQLKSIIHFALYELAATGDIFSIENEIKVKAKYIFK